MKAKTKHIFRKHLPIFRAGVEAVVAGIRMKTLSAKPTTKPKGPAPSYSLCLQALNDLGSDTDHAHIGIDKRILTKAINISQPGIADDASVQLDSQPETYGNQWTMDTPAQGFAHVCAAGTPAAPHIAWAS